MVGGVVKTPIEWLQEYGLIDIPEQELIDKIVMSGSIVESVSHLGNALSGVIVGKIQSITQHPNADKLVICQLHVGQEDVIQIVTGATNVYEGALVPVAMHGAMLAGGLKIKKGKLRGEVSNGMLCSFEELGFDPKVIPEEFAHGILLLDSSAEAYIGEDIKKVLHLEAPVLDFEITPNRSDCLSIRGMAREVAATFDQCSVLTDDWALRIEDTKKEGIDVQIQTPACTRYWAQRVTDVKVKRSPIWLQVRLMQAGMRPINNMVDITNYVLLEYGQPIHAYDASKLTGDTITIRETLDGEEIITLDGEKRVLGKGMVGIYDEKEMVAIAGVKGGESSQITPQTTEVLLEIAHFNPSSIRHTSKQLGLRSEASHRFERGVPPTLVYQAAQRVRSLIEMLEVGTVSDNITDHITETVQAKKIKYDPNDINNRLGISLSDEEIVRYLNRLEIRSENNIATIPSVRLDLKESIDLVEEVARLYGYNKLPSTLPSHAGQSTSTLRYKRREQMKDILCACGCSEVLTYSFVSPEALKLVEPDGNPLMLLNPLGEEYSAMRTTLLPGMLEVVQRNYNRKNRDLRLFELGTIFVPQECEQLVLIHMGMDEDFYTLKATVEQLLRRIDCEPSFQKAHEEGIYHPGRMATIDWSENRIGMMGELHPSLAEKYDLDGTRVYVAVLSMEQLLTHKADVKKYVKIPSQPAVERDLALVVDETVSNGELMAVLHKMGGEMLASVELFDVYRSEQLGAGKKSMAYALQFRGERTLSDNEVNKQMKKMLQALEEKLSATLRDM